MIFRELSVAGAYLVEPEPHEDERGLFARTFCAREFEDHGLDSGIAQISTSFNRRRGTLRGMHLQAPPHEETKLVRCTAGAIFDVVCDLRAGSPTFATSDNVELSGSNRRAVYIPRGCAHGFLCLVDGCEVEYAISTPYQPSAQVGVRWDDPAIGIRWPFPPTVVSARDHAFPPLDLDELRARGVAALLVSDEKAT